MSKKTMLATIALGAAVAFAGPAFAEKMKAALDGKAPAAGQMAAAGPSPAPSRCTAQASNAACGNQNSAAAPWTRLANEGAGVFTY